LDRGAGGERGGEAQPVDPVVDHGETGREQRQPFDQSHQQGEGQVAVGDGGLEGPGSSTLPVDMDPLTVERAVGEIVDAFLVDEQRFGRTQRFVQQVGKEGEIGAAQGGPPEGVSGARMPSCSPVVRSTLPVGPCSNVVANSLGTAVRMSASTPNAASMPLPYLTSTSVTIT